MQRAELMEFILRMAKAFTTQVYQEGYSRVPTSQHLQEFIDLYLKPVIGQSAYTVQRKQIRGSSKLNELLYDNLEGLGAIFDEFPKFGCSLPLTVEFFQQFTALEEQGLVSLGVLEESYTFSQMTVLDETNNMKKYGYLTFVEFLEMICRVAVSAIAEQDVVESKVHALLKIIYEHRYKDKKTKWKASTFPLAPITHAKE